MMGSFALKRKNDKQSTLKKLTHPRLVRNKQQPHILIQLMSPILGMTRHHGNQGVVLLGIVVVDNDETDRAVRRREGGCDAGFGFVAAFSSFGQECH